MSLVKKDVLPVSVNTKTAYVTLSHRWNEYHQGKIDKEQLAVDVATAATLNRMEERMIKEAAMAAKYGEAFINNYKKLWTKEFDI